MALFGKTKICTKCGCTITYGINGCQMYDECSTCHPVSYPSHKQSYGPISYDELNSLEDRCIGDCND